MGCGLSLEEKSLARTFIRGKLDDEFQWRYYDSNSLLNRLLRVPICSIP